MADKKEALLEELKRHFVQLQKIDKEVLKYLPKDLIDSIKKAKGILKEQGEEIPTTISSISNPFWDIYGEYNDACKEDNLDADKANELIALK